MANEVIFPPNVQCQDEDFRFTDDMTEVFRPSLARGLTQRQVYGGPRLMITRRVVVRQAELGAMFAYLQDLRGKARAFYTNLNYQRRGSFPNTELLSNNTFSSGTTGFNLYDAAIGAMAVTEQVMRIRRIKNGNYPGVYQTTTPTINTPYACRAFAAPGFHTTTGNYTIQAYDGTYASSSSSDSLGGYLSCAVVPQVTSLRNLVYDQTAQSMAGDFFDIPYISTSQCALVDNGANLLQQSDTFDNAYWTKAQCTANANSTTAPDGTLTADGLQETAVTNNHEFSRAAVALSSSSASDICFSAYVRAGTRGWVELNVREETGNTDMAAYFNLSTGAVGTLFNVTNWVNTRAFTTDMGDGWYLCSVVSRKTNAATTVKVRILAASANGTNSYLGVAGSDAIAVWRASLTESAVPTLPVSTTSAAQAATGQTGNGLRLKGLPVSTTGLLLKGDLVEVAGQLVMCTDSLDSNSSGLGYLQFGPALVSSPADNAPVIVANPFGKFIQASDPQITNRFGQYAEISFDMEQVYT